MRIRNLTGKKFGRLTVVGSDAVLIRNKNGKGYYFWETRCDCGQSKFTAGSELVSGGTKSCGCLVAETTRARSTTHGKTKTKTFKSWIEMKTRCNSNAPHKVKSYKSKGIKVCERWSRFENFLDDMGERPKGMSLDRIDNDGDYCPENCRWATPTEQVRNRRNARWVKYGGEAIPLVELAKKSGIDYQLLYGAVIRRAVSPEDAVSRLTSVH